MNSEIVTIMCCHEAAHAIAAYRLRFPFRYVRITVPVDGTIVETDLGVDSKAMDVAHSYLTGQGIDTVRFWAGYLSVLAIAKFVNEHYNGVPEVEAAGYASDDFKVLNERLAKFTQPVQEQVTARLNEMINDVWGHPRFVDALTALANALLERRYLTADDVTTIIEDSVGIELRTAAGNPNPEHIRGSAYYDYTRRIDTGEAGTPVGDWLLSERALRYAVASVTQE